MSVLRFATPTPYREHVSVTYGPISLATELVADWRARAACSGYPNSLFFPATDDPDDASVEKAKSVCAVCPVIDDCLEYALETNQRSGIWGGTSERERKSLRRKWLAERRRSA
jgi:WhiB family transcriptional regulator, redox-sensing transcriptional regulator